MPEKKKAEEREQKKKERSKGEKKPKARSSNETVYKVYRFDDWASI